MVSGAPLANLLTQEEGERPIQVFLLNLDQLPIQLAIQDVIERHRSSAQATVEEFNEVASRYRNRLEALSVEFEGEVAELRERFAQQREAFETEIRDLEVAMPDLPEGSSSAEPDGWMFNSDRDFLDQTQEFQRRQRKL